MLPLHSVSPVGRGEDTFVYIFLVACLERFAPSFFCCGFWVFSSPFDPLLAKSYETYGITFLCQDGMRFGVVVGCSFRGVIIFKSFSSIDYAHFLLLVTFRTSFLIPSEYFALVPTPPARLLALFCDAFCEGLSFSLTLFGKYLPLCFLGLLSSFFVRYPHFSLVHEAREACGLFLSFIAFSLEVVYPPPCRLYSAARSCAFLADHLPLAPPLLESKISLRSFSLRAGLVYISFLSMDDTCSKALCCIYSDLYVERDLCKRETVPELFFSGN